MIQWTVFQTSPLEVQPQLRAWPFTLALCLSTLLSSGCTEPVPYPTPDPSPGASPDPIETPTAWVPTPTLNPVETPKPTPTATPEVTEAPSPTSTPGVTPTSPPELTPTPSATPAPPQDVDEDGFTLSEGDCNDLDDTIYPEAPEIPYDGIDQDCSGTDLTDQDEDGFQGPNDTGEDCNDLDASISPAASEVWDGIDNDCNGLVDDGVLPPDADNDGYATVTGDCDDNNNTINPGAAEQCDGIDNNCNSSIDEGVQLTFYFDGDQDGYGQAGLSTQACTAPAGYVADASDCNDSDGATNPSSAELCDGLDNNCNSVADEGLYQTFYLDGDSDGYGSASSSTQACYLPSGYVSDNTDCDDSLNGVNPGAAESCDGLDNNCNSTIDEGTLQTFYLDGDNDGYGTSSTSTQACTAPAGYVADSSDCNDASTSSNPGAAESCDGLDNNCNSSIDEGTLQTFYLDGDNDGYGTSSTSTQACSAPAGYVANSSDCNDASTSVNPGVTEVCDSLDNNCNGSIDEGVRLSGAVHYWSADDNALDSIGGANGTVSGATYTTGKFGKAWKFDGINDVINVGTNAGNFGTGDFTLSLWLNSSNPRLEGVGGRRPTCSNTTMIDIRVATTVGVEIDQNGGGSYMSFGGARTVDSRWHHITVTRKGTVGRLYFDGQQIAAKSSSVTANVNSSSVWSWGKSTCTDIDGTSWLSGALDDIVFFNRELSTQEIQQLATGQITGACVSK